MLKAKAVLQTYGNRVEQLIRNIYVFQGLQIGILNHPVTVQITELLTIQWSSLQGDSLNF